MSVDMVGWHKTSGYVKYSGSGTIKNGKQWLLDNALIPDGLHVKVQNFEKSIFTATDTKGFAEKGVPTLSVSTGLKSPYHKPEDMAHLIDYEGMALITEHLTNIVQTFSQDDTFRASGKIASKHNTNKKVVFGISANIGSNYHVYTRGELNGKPTTAFGIGINSQVNMKFIAIRPEIFYDQLSACHPQGKITTHGLTVPLNFVLQTPASSSAGLSVYAGPYYSYKFKGKQGKAQLDFDSMYKREEVGLNIGMEMRVVNLRVGLTFRNAYTDFSRIQNVDGAQIRNKTTFATLGYIF